MNRVANLPEDVAYALDRMCTPLDSSRLAGATAEADERCMKVIRDHILESASNAQRYCWLRERLDSADFCYGEPVRSVLVFGIDDGMSVSADLDKTIDDEIARATT